MKRISFFIVVILLSLTSCSQEVKLNNKFSPEFIFDNKWSEVYHVSINQTEFLDGIQYNNVGSYKIVIINNEVFIFNIKIIIQYITEKPNIIEQEILKTRFVNKIVDSLSLYFIERNNYTSIKVYKPIEVYLE